MANPRHAGEASFNRRQFLGRCGGCALAAGCLGTVSHLAARPFPQAPQSAGRKPRIQLVFSHIPTGQPTWPYITYDYEPRKKAILEGLSQACPELELLPATAHNAEDAQKLIAQGQDIDGYIVSMLGIWTGVGRTIAATGKPTLLVDDLYAGSGEFLIDYSVCLRQGLNVAGVSSSRDGDLFDAAKCLATIADPAQAGSFGQRCRALAKKGYAPVGDMSLIEADAPPKFDVDAAMKRLSETAILLVGRPMHAIESQITQTFGTRVVPIDFPEVEDAYRQANPDEAKQIAQRWMKEAEAVVEPSAEEITRSAAMYLAMKSLMAKNNAKAVTVNCLGGFYGGHMTAYPCLGFTQLNNDGLVGACEADMRSTITMLAMSELVGRPGYISDPVIDTSKNQIIYAHCVAPTKVYGPNGAVNPCHIRSHSEDRKGASLRSLMPLNRMTTTIELDPGRKEIVFHQAKSVANVDEDKACRTKLAAEVKGDMEKLLSLWDQWGWHRVTFYGDLKEPVAALAEKLGYPVIEEA